MAIRAVAVENYSLTCVISKRPALFVEGTVNTCVKRLSVVDRENCQYMCKTSQSCLSRELSCVNCLRVDATPESNPGFPVAKGTS